jgi:Domain of unknown function (DUF6487)
MVMPKRNSDCPKCKAKMEPGFVPDTAPGGSTIPTWVAGEPDLGWSGPKLKGKARYPIEAYCCQSCGYLEFYAAIQERKPTA